MALSITGEPFTKGAHINVLASRKVGFLVLANWRDRVNLDCQPSIRPTGASFQERDSAGTREELRRMSRPSAKNGWPRFEQLRRNDARQHQRTGDSSGKTRAQPIVENDRKRSDAARWQAQRRRQAVDPSLHRPRTFPAAADGIRGGD